MKSNLFSLLTLQQKLAFSSQKGLTLVESLAALVISAIILTAIAPPILFSAATRIQARNTEQAQSVAIRELDRVRAILTRDEKIKESKFSPESSTSQLSDTTAPSELVKKRSDLKNINQAFTVDTDSDGTNDFFVQLIRDQGVCFNSGPFNATLAVFKMGVRVYDIAAETNLGSLKTEPASLQPRKGLGERTTNPLAVTYSVLSRSDVQASRLAYQQYLKSGGSGQNCS